ncbi:peptidylprolyl isomerase [Rhodovulum sp. YNF3179]|uniref:peptidylprolyl isomerase n=1 Tax=Rhodovulum sp. YNF3179 TaxID=3425127 RepID=UPI003D351CB3
MARLSKLVAGAALAAGLAASAATAQETPAPGTVLATVNGTEITLGHLVALRERLPEQYQNLPDEVLFNGMLDQLVQQTVLQQEIEGDLNAKQERAFENERRAFLASEMIQRLSGQEVSEAEIEEAYRARYADAAAGTEYNASHILVETEDEAREILGLLEDGGDFAALAQERSTGPSGPRGGELGWFSEGMMVAPFEEAVLEMETGAVAGPVQTQFGWHVIKLNDTRQKEAPALEEVRADILGELQGQKLDQAVTALTEAAEIERADVDIDPSVIRDVTVFDQE